MYASLDRAFSFPGNEIKSLAPVEGPNSCTNIIRHMRSCDHCIGQLHKMLDMEITKNPHVQNHPKFKPIRKYTPFGLTKQNIIKLLIVILLILIVLPLCLKTVKSSGFLA